MKKTFVLISLVWYFSCQAPDVQGPIWINPLEEWSESDGMMRFKVQSGNWGCIIQTSTHPIIADFSMQEDEVWLAFPKDQSFVSGQAFIHLALDGHAFSFPVRLKQDLIEGKLEDIRSPKTLSTDSSLVQQQLLYSFGKGGNLVPLTSGHLFEEHFLSQGEKIGTFAGDSDSKLSSYYITAGTPESIPLQVQFDKVQNRFAIQAGPLQDAYQNQVANGTLITFIIQNDQKKWMIEEVAREGFAGIHLSGDRFEGASIYANVARVFSVSLNLQKP